MINKLISFSVRNKFIIGLFILVWIGWGVYSAFNLPLNTMPDLTNNQVKITTYTPDLATEEVERLITYPIELEMGNLPGLEEIRSRSKFGLSDITLVFEDDMGMYKPRQLVKEKLKSASDQLPEGAGEPSIGPMSSGLGEIYQYVLTTSPGYDTAYSAMDLREIQDWIVKKELINIPGVVGINTMGGFLKQYEVAVNPEKLKSHNLTVTDIYEALKKNNANTGGNYIEKNRRAYFIRGEGLIQNLDELRTVTIKNKNGTPLQIKDVATVQFGHAPRFGAFTYNGKGESVGGKIMMLRGENPAEVIANIKERLPQVKAALPEGVELKPFLDRSTLIKDTTDTVVENLTLGALIVIFVLVILMGSMRSGLITASVIPLSLLFALGIMHTFGFSANLISLGAIDFGIIIDGAVIIIEFTVFQINRRLSSLKHLKGKALKNKIDQITIESSNRMMRTAFFGQLIILVVFLPVLALSGQEGQMFRPMALVFGSALIGAIILCFTYVPMMSAWILRPDKSGKIRWADRFLVKIKTPYHKILRQALRYRYAVLSGVIALFIGALLVFANMGSVFIPTLDEGDFAIHPILQPGTSLSETVDINTKLEQQLLKEFPDEVDQVATKIGTGEIPTDPMSLEMAKMIINLKPKDEWTRTDSKDELATLMKQEMSSVVPGVNFFFVQPIEMLFKHLLTGSSADIQMNIYGEDLNTLARLGEEAKSIISDIPGAGDLNVQQAVGLPQIVIDYDRDKLAQYGVDIQTVNKTIQSAYSGAKAGIIYEGERQFSQVVRLEKKLRNNPEAIGDLYVRRADGNQVKLKEIANIKEKTGPASISREGVKRKLEVGINIGDRDTESFIEDVQQKLSTDLDLPKGYNISYKGDFQSLQSAKKRLSWVVPLVLGFIFVLLYFSFNSLSQALLVFSAVPLATIGGIFSLWIRDMPFSISAGIGFIALFGIAVLNGVVLMSFFNELKAGGMKNPFRRIYHGTEMRLRPVILTAVTDALGFLPMAISTSAGAEVQRPLATVVVGGLITATLLTLIVLPIIYSLNEKKMNLPVFSNLIKNNRKKNKNLLGVLLIVTSMLLFPDIAKSQTSTDTMIIKNIDQATQVSLDNHPEIQAQRLRVKQQKKLKATAWDLPDTRIAYEKENEADDIQTWTVEQAFNLPVEYIARKNTIQRRIREENAGLTLKESRIKRNLHKAYNEVLFAKEKLSLLKELDSIFRKLYNAGKLRFETGDISYLEKTSAQAKHKEIQIAREQAENELRQSRQVLKEYLYINKPFRLSEDHLSEVTFRKTINEKDSLSNNPLINVSKRKYQTSLANSKAVQAVSWPDPFFRFSRKNLANRHTFNSFEVGLTLPLDIWAERSRNKAAEIAAESEYQNLQAAKNTIYTNFINSLNELNNLQNQLEYYHESRLKESTEIIKSASKQYQSGNIDYLQYIQYFDQATNIKLGYLELLRKYNRQVIDLKFTTGQ
ncbi:MAG: CusA/CzcA family heavy metal efflux RND transporter [Bacteroidota bacterium]